MGFYKDVHKEKGVLQGIHLEAKGVPAFESLGTTDIDEMGNGMCCEGVGGKGVRGK